MPDITNEKIKRREELYLRAMALPTLPGVYIMKGRDGKIIYVGKSKSLKNRVSQYFNSERYQKHSIKTQKMVDSVYDFEFMLTDTEIEALALENKLIKLNQPKYNIRLKDAKSYPYIKVFEKNGYPMMTVIRTRANDGGKYFGPYSGMAYAYDIMDTVKRIFALPSCKYVFPRDKVRPCLYAHINQCSAPCTSSISIEELKSVYKDAMWFLSGNIRSVKVKLEERMMTASENLAFELAALWRDRIKALDKLYDKQKIVGTPGTEYDALAVHQGAGSSCIALGKVRDGTLIDVAYNIIPSEVIIDPDALINALFRFYRSGDYIPQEMLIDYPIGEDDIEFFTECLSDISGGKVNVRVPQRGDKKQLCLILLENAKSKAEQKDSESDKINETLFVLARAASLEVFPMHIEAIDISNYGTEAVTAGIVSFKNGKPDKQGYRSYNIKTVTGQDDYACMAEAIKRRISHKDEEPLPDLLLLDGGIGHVNTVKELLRTEEVYLQVLGMVKDEHHKTRTLTDGENEISIGGDTALFRFIYAIQEEVHRFVLSRMKKRKKKSMFTSALTDIEGIGEKKAQVLLSVFGSVKGVGDADEGELSAVKGITKRDAENIVRYFKENKNK